MKKPRVDEPATERQLAYMEDLGIDIPGGVSKMEASSLIDAAVRFKYPASDAQKRRLRFYGIDFRDDISKKEASEFIDDWIHRNPESEDAYQKWKASLPEWDEYGEFPEQHNKSETNQKSGCFVIFWFILGLAFLYWILR